MLVSHISQNKNKKHPSITTYHSLNLFVLVTILFALLPCLLPSLRVSTLSIIASTLKNFNGWLILRVATFGIYKKRGMFKEPDTDTVNQTYLDAVLTPESGTTTQAMTPSTPPRSRGTRYLTQPNANAGSNGIMQPQRTPQKPSQNLVPVTPSTARPFKNAPLLVPPNASMGMTSPFNGLNSPQRSPFPKSSVKRTLFQFESHDDEIVREEQKPLGRVNRMLFPTEGVQQDEEEEEEVLLPPADPPLPGSCTYHSIEMNLMKRTERRLLKMYPVRPATR